ncbi:MAG: ABC-type transport auxiliary lipoprotein family protein [Beijerinckiaceae bacterium]
MAGRDLSRRMPARSVLALTCAALAFGLAGCSGAPPLTYDLTAPHERPVRQIGLQIVVTKPSTVSPFDSERIVVRSPTMGLTVLPGAQWSDELPDLLQSRIIQAFENAKLLKAVGRPSDRLVSDYNLNTEIRRFEIDAGRGEAVVEIVVKFVGDRSGRIAAARVFEARVPGSAGSGAEATAALDAALAQVLRQLVAWTSRGWR